MRSSLGWPVLFSIATPSVCKIELGSSLSLTETINGVQLAPSAVHFLAPGTCTIDVRPQESSPGEEPEAHQSFTVQAAPVSTSAPTDTGRTPSSLKPIGAKQARVLCTAKASKCATLIIHTYGSGGRPGRNPGERRGRRPTSFKVSVYKLGRHGEVLGSLGTYKHRLRVTPGRYEVRRSDKHTVVVRAGQTREVTVEIAEK